MTDSDQDRTARSSESCCRRSWTRVVELALTLWVVRVPLTFVVIGVLILTLAPQAQDLFVELALASNVDEHILDLRWGNVAIFLLLLFFFWAMPTHYAARLLLSTDARYRARVELAMLQASSGCIRAMEKYVPRVLGCVPFIAVLAAIWRSHANLPVFDSPTETEVMRILSINLAILAGLVVVALGLFVLYLVRRPNLSNALLVRGARFLVSFAAPLFRVISPGVRDPAGAAGEAQRDLGRALLILVFALFALVLMFEADWAAEQFPRALAVPLVLGGWLPVLAYLSGLGRSLRAPLILGVFVLIGALTAILGDNHSVRRMAAANGLGPDSRMSLNDAVDLWMTENNCKGAPQDCPRPVIVVASGGASRAGFFTASVLGYLLQEADQFDLDAGKVKNRIFAISSVSGSAVGAVMSAAALAARSGIPGYVCRKRLPSLWWGREVQNWRDCLEALTSGDFLTPVFIGFAFHDMVRFGWWRDRAAILEEAWERRFRDVVEPQPDQGRCVGLQCPFLTLRPRAGHWLPLLVINGTSETGGNRIVTTVLKPDYAPADRTKCPTAPRLTEDKPCLVFAHTRHFHDLLLDRTEPPGWLSTLQIKLLAEAHSNTPLDDVSVSTAAHNSARFPLISPPGNIRNRTHEIVDRIVDGGYVENYGALSGMELAQAIHEVEPKLYPFVLVISNDPDDPLDPQDDDVLPRGGMEATKRASREQYRQRQMREPTPAESLRAVPDADDNAWFTEVTTPLTTFANTRTARGVLAVAQLRSAMYRLMPNCANVVHVRVWPQMSETSERSRAVSMSWWLSKPVQRHLHQQTEFEKNENENGPRLRKIWGILNAKSSSCLPPSAAEAAAR